MSLDVKIESLWSDLYGEIANKADRRDEMIGVEIHDRDKRRKDRIMKEIEIEIYIYMPVYIWEGEGLVNG